MKRGCGSPTGFSPAEKEYRKMPSPSPLSYSQVASGTRDSGRVMTDDDLSINEGAMRTHLLLTFSDAMEGTLGETSQEKMHSS